MSGETKISRKKIMRLQNHLDKLQSEIEIKENNFKHRQRYKRRRASGKLRIRIRNMINDFHRKLCKMAL